MAGIGPSLAKKIVAHRNVAGAFKSRRALLEVHGAAGVTQYTPLAEMYAHQRTLRIADGPDEVHKMTIARREIMKHDPDFRMSGGGSSKPWTPTDQRDDVQVFTRP